MRVQGQQRTTVKKEEGEAEEKEHALEIPPSAVPENDNHPEELDQSAQGIADQPEIEQQGHNRLIRRNS